MSIQAPELIRKSIPIQVEGAFALIIGFIIVANTSTTDIIFHDSYVLPAIATCIPSNQDPTCMSIREGLGLPASAQMEIGNIYWQELARQAIFIGFIMFTIRIGIGYFLMIQGIRKIRLTTVLMAVFWGLTGTGLFLFGFVDTLYYVLQGKDAPAQLSWLNNAGLFTETRSFTGDTNTVEKEDLYLTNTLGILIIVSFLIVIMISYANSGMAKRGIA